MNKFFVYIVFFLATSAIAQEVCKVDCEAFNTFGARNIKYCIDENEVLSIDDVISNEKLLFKTPANEKIIRYNLQKTHWFLLEVQLNHECKEHLIVELFDFKYQKGQAYLPNSEGVYDKVDFGYLSKFDQKTYKHKNFVFDLNIKDTNVHKLYFKIKSNSHCQIIGSIRNDNVFMAWALNEYFYLALFYGIVISLFLYNLFIFIYLKDITYLYYTLYIAFAGLWSMCNDGLGFQYLWPEYPMINKYVFPITNFFMVLFLALYTKKFFNTAIKLPLVDKVIIVFILLRIVPYFIWVFDLIPSMDFSNNYFMFDTVFVAILLCAGIMKLNKQKQARLFVIGFALLLIGYIISALSYFGLMTHNLYSLYSINIGMALNMIFITVSLVSRLRSLIQESEIANQQILYNLKEKEFLKDELNRDLETKVLLRTRELTEKNEELNSFVYRASHDIKGPISSLMGLAKIGQLESDPERLREYFKHVMTSSEKLDKTLNDLLQLSHVNEIDLKNEETDLRELITEILHSKQFDKKHEQIKIETEILSLKVNIDQRMLKPIIQNLLENSFKYADLDKNDQQVKIKIHKNDSRLFINVWDNGIGIPDDYQDKVFEKFFRVGVKGSGSGLGLHIVQRCVEKLRGSVELVSEIRKGTSVNVEIPIEN